MAITANIETPGVGLKALYIQMINASLPPAEKYDPITGKRTVSPPDTWDDDGNVVPGASKAPIVQDCTDSPSYKALLEYTDFFLMFAQFSTPVPLVVTANGITACAAGPGTSVDTGTATGAQAPASGWLS